MPYQVFWQVPHEILCVHLEGHLSLEEFHVINEAVVGELGDEGAQHRYAILIDITHPASLPQAFQPLRESQAYARRRDVKYILVVGRDKLLRLMLLLTFNLCRPALRFVDTMEEAFRIAHRPAIAPHE
ncbi:MAG: hypothetical protein IT323_00270 [Anaerolineae bacterium]|nr:hypothetical protein [Anaerolineae bacterium]